MKQNGITSKDSGCPTGSGNIFDSLPPAVSGEDFKDLLNLSGVRIERIVSRGQATPPEEWYDQPWDEWVLLLKGSALLRLAGDDEPRRLQAGDFLLLPAGRKHRVEWTAPGEPTVWLAVHLGEPAP